MNEESDLEALTIVRRSTPTGPLVLCWAALLLWVLAVIVTREVRSSLGAIVLLYVSLRLTAERRKGPTRIMVAPDGLTDTWVSTQVIPWSCISEVESGFLGRFLKIYLHHECRELGAGARAQLRRSMVWRPRPYLAIPMTRTTTSTNQLKRLILERIAADNNSPRRERSQ